MAYCEKEEIMTLFGDISDNVDDGTLTTALNNSTDWIDNKLSKNFIGIPPNNATRLRAAAIYYAASDILYSLYQGEEYQSLYDAWFNKAQEALDDFIDGYLNSDEADTESTDAHQRVKHRHGLTYNQKRGRGRRWVR